MKILHILNHTHKANGHVNVAIDLACEQARQGFEVGILAGDSYYHELLQRYGVKYLEVPFNYRGPLVLAQTIRNCARAIQEFQPTVVHSHMVASTVIARLLQRRNGFRLISTVHNSFDRQALLMGLADSVVCVSDAVRELMVSRGLSRSKISVVTNGTVGSARRPTPAPEAAALKQPAIATVCGLHERKGVQDLIVAFERVVQQFPQAHLYIVGEGPARTSLEQQARACKASGQIEFLGFRDDPRDVLRAASVFALASHADPFPLVILEALEAGCAIVATAVDGIPEALDFGKAGLLVPPKDPGAMAGSIASLLGDPALLRDMRAAALERSRMYSATRMVNDYKSVYGSSEQLSHAGA